GCWIWVVLIKRIHVNQEYAQLAPAFFLHFLVERVCKSLHLVHISMIKPEHDSLSLTVLTHRTDSLTLVRTGQMQRVKGRTCGTNREPRRKSRQTRIRIIGYIQSQKDMPRCVLHAVLRIHQCHDAISSARLFVQGLWQQWIVGKQVVIQVIFVLVGFLYRSEEHTSELQSRENLVCRLLLEK